MHLAWGPDEETFRTELVAFLEEHAPPEARVRHDFAGEYTEEGELIPRWARDWQATLFDHGWMIPGYPPELGGRSCTPVQTLVYLEEMATRGIPRSLHFPGYAIVAPSLLEFGDDDQKRLAPAAVRGDTIWCIGMSEPDAGSDLAGLKTRAELDDDHFVVNGQKVWTSYADAAQMCCCYVRTNPDAPKHKGISLLIVPMDTPGIEVRPLRHISGSAGFAEVFFTDVVVPRAGLVGGLDDGWRITQGSLAHERAGLWVEGVARLEQSIDGLVALAKRRSCADDPIVRRRIAEGYQRAASLRALGYKGFTSFAQGSSAPEHSYMKMATSELGKALYELGMEIQGPYGPVTDSDRGEERGRWVDAFFVSFANTIAGGSSEIQRNIIAQRVLGLPPRLTVDFALTAEQELLRETARNLLARECPTELLRALADDPVAARPLEKHLREFAALGVGSTVDLCVFAEETGYVAAPGNFFAVAALFAPLLAAAGAPQFDATIAGELTGTVALAGRDGHWVVNNDPVKTFVLEADRVDVIAVVDAAPSVTICEQAPVRHVATVDLTRRVFEVDVTAGESFSVEPDVLARVIERATVVLGAELVGTARRLFDMTLRYAKERHQFGVPIGSFQAIQHKLADMSLDVERAWSAVYYAAMAIDAETEIDVGERLRAVHVAKAAAGEAAKRAAKDGIQIHGGIGYTWEHDLHLFIRRAYASEALLGTTGWHHDRLAARLI